MNIKFFLFISIEEKKYLYFVSVLHCSPAKGMNVNTAVGRHEKKVFNNMKSRKNCNYIFHDTKRY